MFHHIHIKTSDPLASAEWWAEAFDLEIESNELRAEGDRFLKCRSNEGVAIFISGPRSGEELDVAIPASRFGLEHIGFQCLDIQDEIERLVSLGAVLVAGPEQLANGRFIAFLHTPDDVRVELVQP